MAESSRPSAGRRLLFRLTQGLYHLALGTWFGATLLMGLGAGFTFATIRAQPLTLDAGPTAGTALAPFSQDYLAGNVVNRSFDALTVVQVVCAAVLIVALVAQGVAFGDRLERAGRTWANAARVALVALGLALFASDFAINRGGMTQLRLEMYAEGVTEAQHRELRERFDALHDRSSRAMGLSAVAMAAAALVSPLAFGVERRDGAAA